MIKALYVGDPHTQVSNLAESEKLLTFVSEMAVCHDVGAIVLMGDLFHTHAVIRLEVQEFWQRWLKKLGEIAHVMVLTGNHDMTGDFSSRISSLGVFRGMDNITIVEAPIAWQGFTWMPYYHDKEKFVADANMLYSETHSGLICHQSFSGSKFENGYFDPGGINPDLLLAKEIISGHIHMGQEFGKVWHPGTAMWLTASDANQTKGIWIVSHENGNKTRQFLDTSQVVTPIVSFQWKEGEEKPVIPEGARATIELVGSSEWVAQNKTEFKGKAIQSTITDQAKIRIRRAGKSLQDFIEIEFDIVAGMKKQKLLHWLKELGIVGSN